MASRAGSVSGECVGMSVASRGDYLEGNHARVFILASLLKIYRNKRKIISFAPCFQKHFPPKDYKSLAEIILILTGFFRINLGRWYFSQHVSWSDISGFVLNNGRI